MAELAREAGAETMFCTALGINQNMEEGRVGSVTCEVASHDTPFEIPATEVIIAAGPWASSVYPDASVGGARSHSIVIKPFTTLTDHALDIRTSAQTDYWSESEQGPTIVDMYPRPDGTLYACSFCDASAPLPSTSLEVKPDEKICRGILKSLRAISSIVGESELIIQQACFQPVIIHKGERQRCVGPIVGPAETKGLYLAVAHDSWGIQNGPVSGKVIAELIFDGEARAADLHSLQLEYVLERATHR